MSCFNCGHEISQDARFCECCGAPQTGTREGPLGVVKASPLVSNQYVRALTRFWWLLAVGLGIAAIVAVLSIYRVDLSVPPGVEKKAQITYTAAAQLLVTSEEAPYVRTRVTQEVEGGDGTVQTYTSSPDITTLISAANLYPVLISSDEVEQLRDEMAGPLPGAITTRAIYEVSSPSRFELSQVPVVEVYGHADSPAAAVEITQSTVEAFLAYIDEQQDAASLRGPERIVLEEIQRPAGAIASGGSSLSLPLMLFLVIAAAFLALAILLDRLFPAGISLPLRRKAPSAPVEEPELGEALSAAERERRAQAGTRV
jgi:hypothetical protein